ncbi:hypothetical protein Tco_1508343 [Tanacetum coccineum]
MSQLLQEIKLMVMQSTDNKDVDEVPGKGDDDLSERNGQEKEEGASNKEDDQHVQDFRAELDNLLVQQKEGYANNTNRVSTVNPSVSAAGQGFDNADDQERIDSSTQDVNTCETHINTASKNINTGSSNINTASSIPNDPSMQSLEATGIFNDPYDDREEVGAEADLNNLEITMNKEDGIFISQDKYVADILKKFDFTTVKAASTPIETNKALNKDEEAEDVDVHLYRSMIGSLIDYAGASLDRKSTTGGCQFLGKRLISWQCKKQTIVANSTTEAEYVAAANCCGQVLWIQNQMLDYGFNFMNTKIHIDNESTICIVKNPVFHSKTKHIEIRHHFIRDSYEKKLVQVIKIHTDHNVADLLIKAFDVSRFTFLTHRSGEDSKN